MDFKTATGKLCVQKCFCGKVPHTNLSFFNARRLCVQRGLTIGAVLLFSLIPKSSSFSPQLQPSSTSPLTTENLALPDDNFPYVQHNGHLQQERLLQSNLNRHLISQHTVYDNNGVIDASHDSKQIGSFLIVQQISPVVQPRVYWAQRQRQRSPASKAALQSQTSPNFTKTNDGTLAYAKDVTVQGTGNLYRYAFDGKRSEQFTNKTSKQKSTKGETAKTNSNNTDRDQTNNTDREHTKADKEDINSFEQKLLFSVVKGSNNRSRKRKSGRSNSVRTNGSTNISRVLLSRHSRDAGNSDWESNDSSQNDSSKNVNGGDIMADSPETSAGAAVDKDKQASETAAATAVNKDRQAAETAANKDSSSLAKYSKESKERVCLSKSCTSREDIVCEISKRSSSCIHSDSDSADFPSRSKELNIIQIVTGDKTRFNITWKGPYNYSYRTVKGFEMIVTLFTYGGIGTSYCYFFNTSATDWSRVRNVHDVVYFMDCVELTTEVFNSIHVSLFSYPRAEGDHNVVHIEQNATKVTLTPVALWTPSIDVVQDTKSRSLIVTVGGVLQVNNLHSLKICFILKGYDCVNISTDKLESSPDVYRYRVTGLESNKTYYLYIKPLNDKGEELDAWIAKREPISVDYPPASSLTTTRPTLETTTAPSTPSPPVVPHVVIGLSVALFALLVVLAVCLFHFRKQIAELVQKVGVFRCCTPKLVRYLPRIDVLYIYIKDDQPYFESLVHEHLKFLQNYINLQYQDLLNLLTEAEGKNMARDTSALIDEVCGNKRVLVYVSPPLGQQLLAGEGTGCCHGANHTALPQLLKALATPTRGRGKKKKPILIFTGCYQDDVSCRKYFERDPCFQQLKRFAISSLHAEELVPPHDLLRRLSGCQHTAVAEDEWRAKGQVLLNAARRLHKAVFNLPHYPQPPQINDGACNIDMESFSLLSDEEEVSLQSDLFLAPVLPDNSDGMTEKLHEVNQRDEHNW